MSESVVSMKQLLESGVHFGHATRRWNPKMAKYIFTARNGIYIIDLQKTANEIEKSYAALLEIAKEGGKVLFVGTKKQAQEAVKEEAIRSGQYYVNQRWLGGTLTNFKTIRSRIRRMEEIENMEKDGTFEALPKKEVIQIRKEYDKLVKNLRGIREMKRMPQAMIIVDPRKEEIAIDEWTPENVNMCAERQAEILDCAVKMLKDGGYIVYSTCTFSLEENEMMVDSFLKNYPEFELVPTTERVRENTTDGVNFDGCKCKNLNYTRRCYSHKTKGEGQFVAVLHNTNECYGNTSRIESKKEKIDKTVIDFLNDTLVDYKVDNVMMYNGNPVYFTPDFEVPKGAAFCCGITIGEVKKNYILPHHQFFMGLGKYFKRKIDLSADSDEIKKYLHGEEFETDCQNGWAVIMVDGCSVGGAKVVNGRAKNHYPKGLRTK